MSLLDTASLVITPNGYKEGTLYSVIPNTTLGDMTVARATTATRVNSAGLIELVPYNLMTYSQLFTNAIWTKDNSSLTSGFTSPSGAADAFKLIESATTAVHNIYISFAILTLGNYTTSIYIKKGERFKVAIADRHSGVYVSYNLNTGTIIDSLSLVGTIESLDNDWYRLTATTSSTVSVYVPQFFILQDSYTTGLPITLPYLGDGTSGVYIWGAQLVEGLTAKDYLRTETRLNIPRLDYSNGSCPSLLVEPQRTNLVLYSEQFDNADWNNYALNVTVTANTTISPDGTQNADTVAFGAFGFLYQSFAIIGLASVTFSIYSKSATQIIVFGGATPLGTDVYTTINVGNGWFRQILTRTFTGGGTGTLQILPFGNNVTAFLWGCQVEAGSYPTSYIPTTSAAVTRNADVISKTGISSLIGQTEGVIFVEGSTIGIETVKINLFAALEKTSSGATMRIYYDGNSNVIIGDVYNGSSFSASFVGPSIQVGQTFKAALAYKNNNFVFYVNGSLIGTDTSGSVPTTDDFKINTSIYSNSDAGVLQSIAVLFPTRLTNAELASLTTL